MFRMRIICAALVVALLLCAVPAFAAVGDAFPYEFGGIGFDISRFYKKQAASEPGKTVFDFEENGLRKRLTFEVSDSAEAEADFESAAPQTLEQGMGNLRDKGLEEVSGEVMSVAGHPAFTIRYRTAKGQRVVGCWIVNETSGKKVVVWFQALSESAAESIDGEAEDMLATAYPRDSVRSVQAATPTPAPTPDARQEASISSSSMTEVSIGNMRIAVPTCFGSPSEKDGSLWFVAESGRRTNVPGTVFLQLGAVDWTGDIDSFGDDYAAIAKRFMEPYGASLSWIDATMNMPGIPIMMFYMERRGDGSQDFEIQGLVFYNYGAGKAVCALLYTGNESRYTYWQALNEMAKHSRLDNQSLALDMSKVSADLKETFGGYADICDRMQAAVKQAAQNGAQIDPASETAREFAKLRAAVYGGDWSGRSPEDRAYVDRVKQAVDDTDKAKEEYDSSSVQSKLEDTMTDMITDALSDALGF